MVWFVIGILAAVAALLCVIGAMVSEEPGTRVGAIFGAVVAIAISATLIFGLAGLREVPTKSVGVVTSFGRVVGQPLRPGIHHEGIFTKVNILDETVQTTSFEGNNCLDVRIGGQQTACLDVTFQWKVRDSAAGQLFSSYAHSGIPIMPEITNAVVVRELKQVVNNVLGDYNPIQDVAANANAGNSQFSTFGHLVYEQMQNDIGSEITIVTPPHTKPQNKSVLMPLLRYDSATQTRLNQIQAQYAETAIATQQIATNEAQSKANAAISRSVASGPGVLEQECLNIVQQAIKVNASLPAGFNCFGGSGVAITNHS